MPVSSETTLTQAQRADIDRLLIESDEVVLNEAARLALTGTAPVTHLLARDDDQLIGYGQVADASAQLFVTPAQRRRGFGRQLLETARSAGARAAWAFGDSPAAAQLAEAAGLTRTRVLRQMRRDLADLPPPARATDQTVRIRSFRPGADESAWLEVNARAFADHPEQGAFSRADLEQRINSDWFDPSGFLLAVDRDDRLVGFHWTKSHAAQHPGLGEVYVVGVDPEFHGQGLGAALLLAGLHYLQRSHTAAILYVEESANAAVRLYEKYGFVLTSRDVMYTWK